MNKNNLSLSIHNLSITAKISLGFFLVFVAFILLSITFFNSLKNSKENLEKTALLTENSAKILDINREISDIQRLTSVYSLTGSKTIINKIKKNYKSLEEKLVDVNNSSEFPKVKELVSSLLLILKDYGGNIDALEERYQYRDKYKKEELPNILTEGKVYLEKKITHAKKRNNKDDVIYLENLLKKWYDIHLNSLAFLAEKKYDYKKRIHTLNTEIQTELLKRPDLKLVLLPLLRELEEVFDQAVQANRVYLSLVNVVMSGELIEFTILSKQLRKITLQELDQLLIRSDNNYSLNKKIMYISIFVTIPLLILIGSFYQFSIARGIRSLSDTFENFIKGNLEENIPGLERSDEIGQLAKAADAFRDVSLRIKEAQEKTEAMAKSKMMFLTTMSHEIRTPMNAVLSCTDLLLDEIKKPEQLNLLNTIRVSGDSLLILINDILDYSKIESGKINLEKENFNIHDCVKNVVQLLSSSASEKGVILDTEFTDDFPRYIRSDITRIRQVLVNLIGNGLKFTKNKVLVKCSVKDFENKSAKINFEIIDNGIGISTKAQKNLFKEFAQVDASTTRKYGGTGLGLAISKGIVSAMDGEISVKSTLSMGSTFNFIIPVEVIEGVHVENKLKINRINSNMSEEFPLKILMAEDNKVNQMVAKKLIAKLGYEIDIVANGVDAVRIVQSKQYDVIFMDQHMPQMDGVDATIEIRKLDINQPKIYALTASAFKEDKDRCLSAGMDGFLTKPISLTEIADVLYSSVDSAQKKNNIDVA